MGKTRYPETLYTTKNLEMLGKIQQNSVQMYSCVHKSKGDSHMSKMKIKHNRSYNS